MVDYAVDTVPDCLDTVPDCLDTEDSSTAIFYQLTCYY